MVFDAIYIALLEVTAGRNFGKCIRLILKSTDAHQHRLLFIQFDRGMVFGLPFKIQMFWYRFPCPFGEVFCKYRSFATGTCSYVSALTIIAFSVERYIAICHPLSSHVMLNIKRVIWGDHTDLCRQFGKCIARCVLSVRLVHAISTRYRE